MNVIVMISGVIDPKWPLCASALDAGASAALPAKPSPFDESALECALKLRDADPATHIRACVAGTLPCEALMRAVAAHRLDGVGGVSVSRRMVWDARAFGRCLADIIAAGEEPADIVLMGREFGDFDDGALAPCVAEMLRWRFVGLAQQVTFAQEDGNRRVVLLRERGDLEERIRCETPVLASVTNDRRNRLRYPLMKNVAAARKARFETVARDAEGVTTRLVSLEDSPAVSAAGSCRMIGGGVAAQAAELAALLQSGR